MYTNGAAIMFNQMQMQKKRLRYLLITAQRPTIYIQQRKINERFLLPFCSAFSTDIPLLICECSVLRHFASANPPH